MPEASGLRIAAAVASVSSRDGGPSSVVLRLAREVHAAGCDNIISTTGADGYKGRLTVTRRQYVEFAGAPVIFDRVHAPRRFKASLGQTATLWRLSKSAELVHVHGLYLWTTVSAALVAKLRRIPYVVQPHGGLEPYHQQKSRAAKGVFDAIVGARILRGASAIVCASESEASHVHELGHSQTVVIPHGVAVSDSDRPPSEASLGIERWPNRRVVLFLGRLAKKKNPDVLIRAWARAAIDDAVLLIVGPDDYWTAESLRAIVQQEGCAGSVEVLPAAHGPEKWDLLQRASLFALPSDSENFGITVPEAMTAGTACLVSTAVATASDVLEAEAGSVVVGTDVDDWAAALTAALDDESQLHRMATNAMHFAAERYNWSAACSDYLKLYTDLRRPHE